MDILLLLPLLKGWKYDIAFIDEVEIIKAGQPRVFREYKVPAEDVYGGWVLAGGFLVNNPLTEIELDYDVYHFAFSVYAMYGMGLVRSNPAGVYVPVYDTTAGLYALHYMPYKPGGFSKYLRIAIKAPTDSDVTIFTGSYLGVIINNMDLFRQSIKEVLGLELQKQILQALQKGGK